MITPEQAQKTLNANAIEGLTAEKFAALTKPYQLLGRLIANVNLKKGYGSVNTRDLYLKAFGDKLDINPWSTPEGQQLAGLLFGPSKAHLLPAVWTLMDAMPYQTGYARRPFRRPAGPATLPMKIDRLRRLYQACTAGFHGLDVRDCARYAGYNQWQSANLAPLFAAALNAPGTDAGNDLRELMADIIQGEDDIGKVNRGMLTGLLLTEDAQNWTLVEQLLLAAQRQEGLRQTILESLDETSIGALMHFTGVLLDYKLARFSSVVRAVDTWFGFGWEAPKQKTIERVLTLTRDYLTDRGAAKKALASKDSLEVYVALWSVAVRDVNEALGLATDLVINGDRARRLVGFYFVSQCEMSNARIGEWVERNFGNDLVVDRFSLYCLPSKHVLTDGLVERLLHYGRTLPKEGKTFSGTIFSWYDIKATPGDFYYYVILNGDRKHLRKLCEDLPAIPSDQRQQLLRMVFPDQYTYSLNANNKTKKDKAELAAADPWKRELIRDAAKDRNEAVMATGIRFLGALELETEDRSVILDLLRRKGKQIRSALIKVVLAQPEETLKSMLNELLSAKSIEQRLAGLEIMTVLHDNDKLTTFVLARVSTYQQRGKFNKNEEVLLAKFSEPMEGDISYANGFGVIDHANLTPLIRPELKFGKKKGIGARIAGAVKKVTGGGSDFLFAEFVNAGKMTTAINDLLALLKKHGKHEYLGWGSKEWSDTILLENGIRFTSPDAFGLDARAQLAYLPLAEVWLEWYRKCDLNDYEFFFCSTALNRGTDTSAMENFRRQYQPAIGELNIIKKKDHYGPGQAGLAANLIQQLQRGLGDATVLFQFQVDMMEDMIARWPVNQRGNVTFNSQYGYEQTDHWTSLLTQLLPGSVRNVTPLVMETRDLASLQQLWKLEVYLMAHRMAAPKTPTSIQQIAAQKVQLNKSMTPGNWLTLGLHARGLITDDDLLLQGLLNSDVFDLLSGNRNALRWIHREDMELPTHLFPPLATNLLDLELKRGDLPTDATPYATKLNPIVGIDYLFRTLERLGKETLHRGYYWGNEVSKKVSFSGVVKKSVAADTDTLEAFTARAKTSTITKERWLEVAMYAPQWCPWIAEHLKLPDLEIAVWWFHAHASDYMSPQKEKIVAQFSPIAKEDFAEGAIDVDWFYAAYQGVGKKAWKELHDAAKFISDGNGHRQVKTYSAVMLGEVKITATLKKIKEKRDKVYVKALGLIPFSRTRPEADILRRYNLLQEFKRESKQFGAQRRAAEQKAAEIGLDNLARNAGFDDVTRFGWIMEAEATRAIMERSIVGIDNVTVQLIIDQNGKPDIVVAKDGKPQKTIPARHRKHKAVVLLKEHKTALKRQYSRTRASLETAMTAGVTFTPDDLGKIMRHPIVRPLLAKLVLFVPATKASGFWKDDQLVGVDGKPVELAEDAQLVIAHPAHLYRAVQWDVYQRFAFENELVQPFKQIFRELYLVTKDEKETKNQSLRYQGHQIQPKKSAALLRGRGWTVSESEGLQKVYHKRDVVATMYALADWFSPSDVEAPAIEGVIFRRRRGGVIDLVDLDPVLFSEVMRDIDLVVSVAHVGGVDPEASHSTLEMRGALARESARLFQLGNVEVKQRHVVIEGQLGSYNIHLGSGMVTKNGLQLNIIAVHSQHRGRLFLPFLDDDPKSAEIISKMKLLAEDGKIQDPTVLGQIQK